MTNPVKVLRQRLAVADDDQFLTALFEFVEEKGQSRYDGNVTQLEHALQTATLAADEECSDSAVVSALLHDIGHLLVDEHDAKDDFLDEDRFHERVGANFLKAYFPESVTEPIELHVPAKRYLCTTDDAYYGQLSEASKRSFAIQGGALPAAELQALEASKYLAEAVALRRFDDSGKVAGKSVPDIRSFANVVKRCLRIDRAT